MDLPIDLDLVGLGITRVGDHTALDVVGIPVWFACRPNSRGLAVAQGKGMTDAQARLSAIMESVETAFAERCETLVSRIAPLARMQAEGLCTVPFDRLLRTASDAIDPARTYGWVTGQVWPHGPAIHAPYELVGLDYRSRVPWDHESFHMSSIGLAAHVSRDAAILHALLEVIENDATAALEVFGFSHRLVRPLPALMAGEGLIEALCKVTGAGLDVRFCRISAALPLPVIGCFVGRDVAGAPGTGIAYAGGFACRLTEAEAALAALLEALQSRLTDIAGARDDIEAENFRPSGAGIIDMLPPTSVHPRRGAAEPADSLAVLMRHLADAGIGEVYVFDLAPEDCPVKVVRVLVPDMQSPASNGHLRLGLTATRQILA